MKSFANLPRWIKIFHSVLLASLLILVFTETIHAFSEKYYREKSTQLYQNYVNNHNSDSVFALMNVYAYVKRDPLAYINNSAFKDNIDKNIAYLRGDISWKVKQYEEVKKQIEKCNCYPCNVCTVRQSNQADTEAEYTLTRPTIILVPPDAALFCVDAEYKGECVLLSVGSYKNPFQIGLPNDNISSIWVGDNVLVRIYEDDDFYGSAALLIGKNPDLSLYWINDTNTWNDRISSLKVVSK